MADDPSRFVFIATGGMLPPDTIDFGPMARARMVSLVTEWNKAAAKKKAPFPLPTTVRFVQFNFDSGKVTKYDHPFPEKGTKAPSLKNGDWVSATSADTNIDITLHDNNRSGSTTKTLSITNVYSSVRKSPPDSVMEVSIFSHAFVKGPVLINTDDDSKDKDRSPTDMDGRARTDFNNDMGEASAGDTALSKFIENFDKKGHFRVYGCNVQDVVNGPDLVASIPVNGAVRASGVVRITTAVAHGLSNTQPVTMATINEVSDGSFNGTFPIKDVPSSTSFSYEQKGPDATSGGGFVCEGGVTYKRSAVFQIIDQAFRLPTAVKPGSPLSATAANLKKGRPPTSNVVLDMWGEVMNEAERDVKVEAKHQARAQNKPRDQWDAIAQAAWNSTPPGTRNKLANTLLMMHRQLDPDFYPPPNLSDVTAEPAQKSVSKSWDDVLNLVANKIAESYIFKAAEQLSSSGITCHGAVPGVGGNNEQDPKNLGLMRVCADNKHFGCDDSYGAWLKFYRDFFFLDSDGKKLPNAFDDRNYAQFDSNSVPIVKAHATP